MPALVVTLLGSFIVTAQQSPSSSKKPTKNLVEVSSLSFGEFFETSGPGLRPSAKLQSLNKKRVRVIGFMAQMEMEPEGSFYLVPRPVFCDEEGGGNADLPPEALLVVVPSLNKIPVHFKPGLLEVIGILELGNLERSGQVSAIRLIAEEPRMNLDQQQPRPTK